MAFDRKAYRRKYYQEHKAIELAGHLAYNKSHRKVMNACAKRNRERNPATLFLKQRRYREKHAKRIAEYKRKMQYNVSPEQYQRLYTQQKGRCAICGTHQLELKMKLSVDHDHSCCPKNTACGQCVRGLLCTKCNMGLGGFNDSLDIIQNAKLYLQKWSV